ncbi:MAG: transcription antitermination protein NusB [Burkholderiales bacterium]|nr:transcription antitermination protein NusB [Burkholderiales bacterium]
MAKKSARHLSRSLAVQGIYYHKINAADIDEIECFLRQQPVYPLANYELMHFLLRQGIECFDLMLEDYAEYFHDGKNNVNLIEQIILVVASVELRENLSVPTPVIINEAIELAKLYGAAESHKFINNLVDKVALKLRAGS